MRKLKVADLIGDDLDLAVSICEGTTSEFGLTDNERYSTNWAQGGPIIEREKISLMATLRGGWGARTLDFPPEYHFGPTPLIAAMRCFVASKHSVYIELP